MDTNEIQGEINACKIILEQTDHDILEAIEDIFAADSATELLRALASGGKTVGATIKTRKDCRTKIRKLQADLNEMQKQAVATIVDEPAQDETESAAE